MNAFGHTSALREDKTTYRRLQLNYTRNKKQDHTALLDDAANGFDYEACRDEPWNPEAFSLLYGTPFWDQASDTQRVLLNQLYWVAYYSDIISAEIATIYFNQTSAAALYGIDDFRLVCDTLDLESHQERAHINAFKMVGEAVEAKLFGKRLFTYSMRDPFAETVIFADTSRVREMAKGMLLRLFGLLSAQNAFIGCQYFLIRGLRTLLGKIVQHQLSQYYEGHEQKEEAPIPAKISYYHFQDESYHFNSSTIISHDVIRALPAPSHVERFIMNQTVAGAQKDLKLFSVVGNGLNWHDPHTFNVIYQLMQSDVFGLEPKEALEIMQRCYCTEHAGLYAAERTHSTAVDSYRNYVEDINYLTPGNRAMTIAADNSVSQTLKRNRKAFGRFKREVSVQ